MNLADRLLDFWQTVYLATQQQLVQRDTGALLAAHKLARTCAVAADEAERELLGAVRRHCGACAASGRLYGVGLPVEGSPCEQCAGRGILPFQAAADPQRAGGMLSPFGGVPPTGEGPARRP